ncbi:MAG: hypothetical protein COT67_01025 [Candidatus Tagabacteria bacterium CG09_land_8_20_14_0_10_41_14]|uniref:NYN domain-containing protein n=1 Tax=Candidatus Tagabacteria bacterium CG09_land_8_20_14_0_10_41_14 TaxID=1975021 RepID=A0A2H0WLV7_9BACT|nr:MAG: hypothetical protein COT67_01025 [Candidatus Tagabacteria bacterium CG09_land_8_20_14_0_10_41_14]
MPLIKHKNQRVAVLIDVQNMYHSAKALYKKKVHFKEVLKQAVSGRQLIRAIGYVIRTETGEEKSFFEALNKIGIELKVKDLQIYPGGMKKADWDVGLSIDAVRLADSIIDAIVLVTGDGDFVPLVEFLKGKGRQVEVMAFGKSTSARLKETADDFTDMGENAKRFLI